MSERKLKISEVTGATTITLAFMLARLFKRGKITFDLKVVSEWLKPEFRDELLLRLYPTVEALAFLSEKPTHAPPPLRALPPPLPAVEFVEAEGYRCFSADTQLYPVENLRTLLYRLECTGVNINLMYRKLLEQVFQPRETPSACRLIGVNFGAMTPLEAKKWFVKNGFRAPPWDAHTSMLIGDVEFEKATRICDPFLEATVKGSGKETYLCSPQIQCKPGEKPRLVVDTVDNPMHPETICIALDQ